MSDDTRRVTLNIGDGFPIVLSIDHAKAIRTALSNVSMYGSEEECHTAYVKAADVFGFAVPDGRRLEVSAEVSNDVCGPDVDAPLPLDLDVIDFPATKTSTNGTIETHAAADRARSGLDPIQ